MSSTTRLTLFFTIALIAVVATAYLPGLRGPFLFDDWASLPALGANGPIRDIVGFARYVTSGTADPTGRPLALATFAANARDWPAAAAPFKITNLAIHLANTFLLVALLLRLGRQSGVMAPRVHRAAWLAAALWALHPFLVSTVLYVVQREAMLATTFALLALIAWLTARERFARRRPYACAWLYLGAGMATTLAVLSKANGVVIPLLALAIEATLPALSDDASACRYRRHFRVAVVLPSAVLLTALAWFAVSSLGQAPLPERGWTVAQRLMTEPSVMLDYLARLWLLRPAGGAFFHDQLVPATSLVSPWYAAVPLLVWFAALCVAVVWRRRFPAVAVAILFFIAAHALESTSVPLELYFEHRNYLPATLMFWPLSLAIVSSRYAWLRRTLPAVILAGLFLLTRSQAALWGDQLAQATVWASLQPDSPRAQANAARVEYSRGLLRAARIRIDGARQRFIGEPQIAINLLDIHCATGGVTADDLTYASRTLVSAPRDPGALLTHWFAMRIEGLSTTPCVGLDEGALLTLLQATASNPRVSALPGRQQDMAHLFGMMSLHDGHADRAYEWFAQALAAEPTARVALNEAALLGQAGRPDLGLRHLAQLERLPALPPVPLRNGMAWVHAWLLQRQGYWPNEIKHLRRVLTAQAQESVRVAADEAAAPERGG